MIDSSATPPPSPALSPNPRAQLLSDLRVGTPQQRQKAAIGLGELGNQDEEVIITLQTVAVHDSKESVRKAAQTALAMLGYGKPPPPQRPFYKHWDFWLGFVGWYAFNGTMLVILQTQPLPDNLDALIAIALLLANIGPFVIAPFIHRYFVGGMLAAVSLVYVIAVLFGVFYAAACYAGSFLNAPNRSFSK